MNYLVYTHINRCTGDVFYVGIGNRGRAYDEKSRNNEWLDIVSDCYFDVDIIAKNLPKRLACKIERSLIDMYGIENLTNKTLGGLGALGLKHTESSKEKIRNAQLGVKKSKESIQKAIKTRRQNNVELFKHIETGFVFNGLKAGCDYFGINYKLEHQRITRDSSNKNFTRL